MFHQLIFIILLLGILILDTFSDSRLYYHLLYKRDYLKWRSGDFNDYQDIRALISERKFKLMMTALFGFCVLCVLLLSFALYRLSFAFNQPFLTHLALTSLLLTILGQGVTLCTFPLPGITNIKLSRSRIIVDVIITILNYLCLVGMLLQIVQ